MKRKITLVLVASIALFAVISKAQTPQSNLPQSNVAPLMRMKLDKSKEILEGLTLEDFDKVKTNANLLRVLSMESGWNVLRTSGYDSQSEDFRRACQLIIEAAEEKDISRATLGYVTLTVRCVECHSYMRKQAQAAQEPGGE